MLPLEQTCQTPKAESHPPKLDNGSDYRLLREERQPRIRRASKFTRRNRTRILGWPMPTGRVGVAKKRDTLPPESRRDVAGRSVHGKD